MPEAAPAANAAPMDPAALAAEITKLLARRAEVPVVLDTSYFTAPQASDRSGESRQVLLPSDYQWQPPGAAAPRVPLQLCEFLAYMTGLAYEEGPRVTAYLTDCRADVSEIEIFNSAGEKASEAGKRADAQGFGCVVERKAFVVFRGTSGRKDWRINTTDAMTDTLEGEKDWRYRRLKRRYGALLDKLGDPSPGRHVGFSIAWAALKDQVEDWIAGLLENNKIDGILYTGHSLGGAMAQVAAFDHARIEAGLERDRGIRKSQIAGVVTFGAPMVGDHGFAELYNKLLGDRTVRLESSGDLVPRIMQRWYYRMLYPLRQYVQAGLRLHTQQDGTKFAPVGLYWPFSSEPPLANSDIDAAVNNFRYAAEKLAKDARERAEQARKEAAEKARKEAEDKAKAEQQAAAGGDKSTVAQGDGSTAKPGSGNAEAKPAEPAPSWVYWVVVGVVVLAAAGIAWYFVRRKLFSHDIEQRYALYLSTLSYQQLRAKHGGDIARANAELESHLKFVRGDFAKSRAIDDGNPFFGSVQSLPVKIEIKQDPHFVEYLQNEKTFV